MTPRTSGPRRPLRDLARRAVQTELITVAQRLFEERGFEETTVDAIATEAGMSRRSFFRYFASKEELVLGKYDLYGELMLEQLRSRPDEEPLWSALQAMFAAVNATSDEQAPVHAIERIVDESPSLRAGYLYRLDLMQDALVVAARERAHRVGSPYAADDPTPGVLVRTAFACMVAARAAAAGSALSWSAMVERALSTVQPSVGRR